MNCVAWLFGRGASIACNLHWTVPSEWIADDRSLQVEKIQAAISTEMESTDIDTTPYQLLLETLARRTKSEWKHSFFTTNWDYLLQQEITRLRLIVLPPWLQDSHVFHLNGTVECTNASNIPGLRAPFLLEQDNFHTRTPSQEFNEALRFLSWRQHFIVVGVSFSYETDRAFLTILGQAKHLGVGAAWWHVVDPSPQSGEAVANRIHAVLPEAKITLSTVGFAEWVTQGMPELSHMGVLD